MYIILEIQTFENGATAIVNPINQTTDHNQAQHLYHAKLSAAAISSLPKHTVVLMDEEGAVQEKRCYHHAVKREGD